MERAKEREKEKPISNPHQINNPLLEQERRQVRRGLPSVGAQRRDDLGEWRSGNGREKKEKEKENEKKSKRASVFVVVRLRVHLPHSNINAPPRRASFPFAVLRFERGTAGTRGAERGCFDRCSRGERRWRIATPPTTTMMMNERRPTSTLERTFASPPRPSAAPSSMPQRSTGRAPGACWWWRTSSRGKKEQRERERESLFGRKEKSGPTVVCKKKKKKRPLVDEHHSSLLLFLRLAGGELAKHFAISRVACCLSSTSLSLWPLASSTSSEEK